MLIFDNEGHKIIAKAMMEQTYKMLLTDGDSAWEDVEIPLFNGEIKGTVFGFIAEHEKSFVKVDLAGDIEFNDLIYSRSEEPTNIMLLSFKLRGSELEGIAFRQQIVVSDYIIEAGFENLHFIPSENVTLPGRKLFGENIATRSMEPGSSEVINMIVTF